MLNELGQGGMSSDDSEYEGEGRSERKTGRTTARSVPWRADEVGALLRLVDRDEMKLSASGRQKCGNPGMQRTRDRNPGPSRRPAKAGLPLNYYNPLWYGLLGHAERKELGARANQPLPNLQVALPM